LDGPRITVCDNRLAPSGPGEQAVDTVAPLLSVTGTLLLPKFAAPGTLLIGAI